MGRKKQKECKLRLYPLNFLCPPNYRRMLKVLLSPSWARAHLMVKRANSSFPIARLKPTRGPQTLGSLLAENSVDGGCGLS